MTTPAPDQALNAFAKVTIVTDANAIRSRVASSWLDLAMARRDTPQGVIMTGAVAACAISRTPTAGSLRMSGDACWDCGHASVRAHATRPVERCPPNPVN